MSKVSLAIHGGAGTILRAEMDAARETGYRNALQDALDLGYSILNAGGSSLDAVEASVRSLEDHPLFNAGKGSVFTSAGTHEMDAAIMNGADLNAGAVALVTGIKNPVSLARLVMEKSPHVFMAGKGALEFAKIIHLETAEPPYFFDQFRFDQWEKIKETDEVQLDHATDSKFGTVGAVALDLHGNLAAATSTGGMTNKRYGRIGDSPMIGAGTYANNATCAISCTGSGEFFIRAVVAYDVHCLMEYKGLSLQTACEIVVMDKLPKIGGDGGLIGVDSIGNIAMVFNTEGMYRASRNEEKQSIEIYK